MNQNGEFFSGYEKGWFKWSPLLKNAKELESEMQFGTLERNEPSMELILEYV